MDAESLPGQEKCVAAVTGTELEDVIDACGTKSLRCSLRRHRRLRSVQLRLPRVSGLPPFLLSPCELDVSSVHVLLPVVVTPIWTIGGPRQPTVRTDCVGPHTWCDQIHDPGAV
ncbi:hypothetical protein GCM10009745_57100 [Kribbella yunnanensis]|uniref:Uncharacterized protein n=1 Tax=Kribbella yunnanensis TaxID=190194 RepID=A0ABP4UCS0_9ACTN